MTDRQREMLIDGLDDVADSTIRRQKQEIRERFVDAMDDLFLIARMQLSDIEQLMYTVEKREQAADEPILGPAISSLVAIAWLFYNKEVVEAAIEMGVDMGESRKAPHVGKIQDVTPVAAIEFTAGSSYVDPELALLDYLQNPDKFTDEESYLMERWIDENKELAEKIIDNLEADAVVE